MIETISGKEDNAILKNLLPMLSYFYYYPESEDEMKICLRHYQHYYNIINEDLKSNRACNHIEEIVMSIESNMEYVCN